ncbi:MAG: adenylyltransferase/cytidyltransferase family protein [Candidatus Peribacteraceae bacterium]
MVFGTFDLLHPGHEFFLREAARRGPLTVVVARDENVRRIKGRMPLQTQEQRIEAIRTRFPTATVIPGDRRGFLMPLRKLVPNLILLGYDQTLPPGIRKDDLPCRTERVVAFRPRQFKSSLSRLPGKRGVAEKKKT